MLQINNRTRIRKLDDNNLVVEELKTVSSEKKGLRQEWRHCGYYGNLKSALIAVIDKELLNSLDEECDIRHLLYKTEIIKFEILKEIRRKNEEN